MFLCYGFQNCYFVLIFKNVSLFWFSKMFLCYDFKNCYMLFWFSTVLNWKDQTSICWALQFQFYCVLIFKNVSLFWFSKMFLCFDFQKCSFVLIFKNVLCYDFQNCYFVLIFKNVSLLWFSKLLHVVLIFHCSKLKGSNFYLLSSSVSILDNIKHLQVVT